MRCKARPLQKIKEEIKEEIEQRKLLPAKMEGKEVKQGGISIKVGKMVFLFFLTPLSGH